MGSRVKKIFAIIKKELFRVFKDKRLVFTTILMPGLMIFLLYSIMGEAMTSLSTPDVESEIVVINKYQLFDTILSNMGFIE